MWRLLVSCRGAGRHEALACSRRFLRRRGKPIKEEEVVEPVAPTEVSSFRTGGMPAAPDNSLDNIRAEILRMRSERAASKEKVMGKSDDKKEESPVASVRSEEPLASAGWNEFIEKLRPSEAYSKGQDVMECVTAKDRAARRQLFLDADEVLRKKNKEDTLRYLQLVFNRIGSYHREEVMEAVRALARSVDEEAQCIETQSRGSHKEGDAMMEPVTITREEAREMAWVNVLSGMTDEELRKLWKWGLLDFDTIESLAAADKNDDVGAVDVIARQGDSVSESPIDVVVASAADGETDKEGEGEEDVYLASLPIDQSIETLKNMGEAQELTACVCENVFLGLPTIDLAPAMNKVQHKQYEDISERELRMLESYEEKKYIIKFPASVSTAPTPNASKTNAGETTSTVQSSGSVAPPLVAEKTSPSKMEVTEALMDRALCPSNRFLYAVSRHDAELCRSFEGMERIKRRALLDPVFQAAVEEAHVWEEMSVQPQLQQDGVDDDKSRKGAGTRRQQRRLRRVQSGGPFAKPQHAADIPYFYGNVRSFVPPRGRYNMPAPRLSREESAQLRHPERKKSRIRYSQ
ncbi:hypothetical protein DQ04_09381010 [Trypanosoma grayi]|uniref:hypothetical protein n=1 Tax=Trypanosoma grayi TaxID=71804 RepID=UPI0004F3F22A|nr:hypothetical protein DQ04_09381010 [Trypanosoma grayi]KEG07575.1 hypothetical protein DQ04_09381010 [Trypanosoma grayi]